LDGTGAYGRGVDGVVDAEIEITGEVALRGSDFVL
jgi:hypothetical protein